MRASADNWDLHWSQYQRAAARNPAVTYRLRLIQRLCALQNAAGPVRFLELGCGTGEFAAALLSAHPELDFLGLDRSEVGVAQAARRVPRARFDVADLTAPAPPAAGLFRATHAVCSEVLEHVDDPAALLANARAWMQPGCRLVVTVPGGPMSAFDHHIGHRRHFRPADLAAVLSAAGYRIRECHGAGFPFFNLYRLTVIARGRRLIADVEGDSSRLARVVMSAFDLLFSGNSGRRGWQTVAVAEAP